MKPKKENSDSARREANENEGLPCNSEIASSAPNLDGKSSVSSSLNDSMLCQHDVPETIGPYPVINRLCQGDLSTVYLGHHPDLNRQVAIKLMQLGIEENRELLFQRFIKEVKISDKFDHPNVVYIYDVGEDKSGGYYVAMEYAVGGALARFLDEEGRLDLAFALQVIKNITKALIEANKHSLVHGDIKPQNILVCKGMEIKLANLGLINYIHQNWMKLALPDPREKARYYKAPEQDINGEPIDIRSDIYALGATFYHLVTGQTPYVEKSGVDMHKQKEAGNFKHPKTLNHLIDNKLDRIISKMMARKPNNRYQSPEELLQELEGYKFGATGKQQSYYVKLISKAAIFMAISLAIIALWSPKKNKSEDKTFDLTVRISNFTKDQWEPIKNLTIAQKFPHYTEQVRRSFLEAGSLFDKKVYEEAFHKYRDILKLLQKLQNLNEIQKRCLNEQAKIQYLKGSVKNGYPDLIETVDWKKTEGLSGQASSLFQGGKLNEALRLFKNATDNFTKLLTSSVDQHIDQLRLEAVFIRDQGLTLKAPDLAPEIWQDAEELADHAQNIDKNKTTETVNFWEEAISRYERANDHVIALGEATLAKEKYLEAVSQEDPLLVEKYRETIWQSVSDLALKAEQLMNEHQFQAAINQWQQAIALIPQTIEKIVENEKQEINNLKGLTNPSDGPTTSP